MRQRSSILVIAVFVVIGGVVFGQQQSSGRRPAAKSSSGGDFVSRMMKFDKNKDGKLVRSEVSDTRMRRLFDRADADKDGVVTSEELTALAAAEPTNPGGGPGGFGRPRMGEILPSFIQQRLNLTPAQAKQVASLQKEVDAKLAKILSAEQSEQLKEMQDRGPGGGPPGFGGPGGGPPGGPPGGGFGRPGGGPPGGPGGGRPGSPPPDGEGFRPPDPDQTQ